MGNNKDKHLFVEDDIIARADRYNLSKKILFRATMREITFLLENDYLNEKGKKWANGFNNEEENEDN